jgi:hypothetical protein
MLQSKLNAAKGSLSLRESPRQREIYWLTFQRNGGPWTYEGTLVLTWVATVARTATAGSSGAGTPLAHEKRQRCAGRKANRGTSGVAARSSPGNARSGARMRGSLRATRMQHK